MHRIYMLYDLVKINNVRREQEELRATKNLRDRHEGCINKGSKKNRLRRSMYSAETWAPCSRIVIQLKANLIMGGVRL